MRSDCVEIPSDVLAQHASQLFFAEDDDVLQTFASHSSEKTLTDGIHCAFGAPIADARAVGLCGKLQQPGPFHFGSSEVRRERSSRLRYRYLRRCPESAPAVLSGHARNELNCLRGQWGPAHSDRFGFLAPEQPKSFPMPADDCVRFHQENRFSPATQDARQEHEQAPFRAGGSVAA
jgi:hypothetical protein